MSKIYCAVKLNRSSKRSFLISYFANGTPETYFDENFIDVQCRAKCNRSVRDIKMLIDGQFKKEIPIEDVIFLLVDLVLKLKIRALFCNNVYKVVFFNKKYHPTYYHVLGNDTRKHTIGVDKYSWNNMLEIYKTKQNEQ